MQLTPLLSMLHESVSTLHLSFWRTFIFVRTSACLCASVCTSGVDMPYVMCRLRYCHLHGAPSANPLYNAGHLGDCAVGQHDGALRHLLRDAPPTAAGDLPHPGDHHVDCVGVWPPRLLGHDHGRRQANLAHGRGHGRNVKVCVERKTRGAQVALR